MIKTEIEWLGHSSFLLISSFGKRLLIDPCNENFNFSEFNKNVDIITISHSHFDHCFINKSLEKSIILKEAGLYDFDFCKIKGIESFHDNKKGALRGNNIIFIYKLDNFNICHLGDLGHELSEEIISSIGIIDILFIPVGGNYTINGKEATNITKKLNPKIVIPMHYKTHFISMNLKGPEDFILSINNIKKINSNKVLIKSINNYKTQALIFNYEKK